MHCIHEITIIWLATGIRRINISDCPDIGIIDCKDIVESGIIDEVRLPSEVVTRRIVRLAVRRLNGRRIHAGGDPYGIDAEENEEQISMRLR